MCAKPSPHSMLYLLPVRLQLPSLLQCDFTICEGWVGSRKTPQHMHLNYTCGLLSFVISTTSKCPVHPSP